MKQYTFAMIKPCSYHLYPSILKFMVDREFIPDIVMPRKLDLAAFKHLYGHHIDQPFFEGLADSMVDRHVIPMVVSWYADPDYSVGGFRKLLGATDPSKAESGTIRRAFARGNALPNNCMHGSDSFSSAGRELAYFFPEQFGALASR